MIAGVQTREPVARPSVAVYTNTINTTVKHYILAAS